VTRARPRPRSPLARFAALSLAAGLIAALLAALQPYERAAWLVAYLLLVGFAAQALLGLGQAALILRSGRAGREPIGLETTLWNAGVVAVPAGVFLDARLPVVLGGLSLLAALFVFWRTSRPFGRLLGEGRLVLSASYIALVALMAASSLIGCALAWHRPWL
jgi:hypothetical protein